jgi:hypothetical protein
MPYYNDPSGLGSWWTDEGQDPAAALQGWQDSANINVDQGLVDSLQKQGYTTTGLVGLKEGESVTQARARLGLPATAPGTSSAKTTSTLAQPQAQVDPTQTTTGGAGSPWPGAGVGQLTLRNAQTGETQVIDAAEHDQIMQLTNSGDWVPLNANGNPYTVIPFQGGQMFFEPDTGEAVPLNVLLGGSWTPEQQQAMEAFKQDPTYQQTRQSYEYWHNPDGSFKPHEGETAPPGVNTGQPAGGGTVGQPGGGGGTAVSPTGTTGVQGGNTYPGFAGNVTPVQGNMPIDTLVKTLINNVYSKIQGAEQLFGNINDFAKNLTDRLNSDAGLRDQALEMLKDPSVFEQSLKDSVGALQKQQNELVGRTFEPAIGQVNRTIGRENAGLSPEAKAAMISASKENAAAGYGSAAEQLKTMLASRGAYGGQEPGSVGDIVREFSPLLAARENAVSEGQRATTMADEAARQKNREAALQAAGLSGQLMGQVGQIYDPTKYVPGALQSEANRTQAKTAANEIYGPQNYIPGITGAFNAQTGSLGELNQMLATPFTGANTLANVDAAKLNAPQKSSFWDKLLNVGTAVAGALPA